MWCFTWLFSSTPIWLSVSAPKLCIVSIKDSSWSTVLLNMSNVQVTITSGCRDVLSNSGASFFLHWILLRWLQRREDVLMADVVPYDQTGWCWPPHWWWAHIALSSVLMKREDLVKTKHEYFPVTRLLPIHGYALNWWRVCFGVKKKRKKRKS